MQVQGEDNGPRFQPCRQHVNMGALVRCARCCLLCASNISQHVVQFVWADASSSLVDIMFQHISTVCLRWTCARGPGRRCHRCNILDVTTLLLHGETVRSSLPGEREAPLKRRERLKSSMRQRVLGVRSARVLTLTVLAVMAVRVLCVFDLIDCSLAVWTLS